MIRYQISIPGKIEIPLQLESGESFDLFEIEGEKVSVFRDRLGSLCAGCSRTGYRKLSQVPQAEEIKELMVSIISKFVEINVSV